MFSKIGRMYDAMMYGLLTNIFATAYVVSGHPLADVMSRTFSDKKIRECVDRLWEHPFFARLDDKLQAEHKRQMVEAMAENGSLEVLCDWLASRTDSPVPTEKMMRVLRAKYAQRAGVQLVN